MRELGIGLLLYAAASAVAVVSLAVAIYTLSLAPLAAVLLAYIVATVAVGWLIMSGYVDLAERHREMYIAVAGAFAWALGLGGMTAMTALAVVVGSDAYNHWLYTPSYALSTAGRIISLVIAPLLLYRHLRSKHLIATAAIQAVSEIVAVTAPLAPIIYYLGVRKL